MTSVADSTITTDPVRAALVAAGVQTIVTVAEPCPDGRYELAAGKNWRGHFAFGAGWWFDSDRMTLDQSNENGSVRPTIRVVASAVMATCHVTCVPIGECSGYNAHVCVHDGSALAHSSLDATWPDGETEHDVSDQLPFDDFSSGRWALILTDVELVAP